MHDEKIRLFEQNNNETLFRKSLILIKFSGFCVTQVDFKAQPVIEFQQKLEIKSENLEFLLLWPAEP